MVATRLQPGEPSSQPTATLQGNGTVRVVAAARRARRTSRALSTDRWSCRGAPSPRRRTVRSSSGATSTEPPASCMSGARTRTAGSSTQDATQRPCRAAAARSPSTRLEKPRLNPVDNAILFANSRVCQHRLPAALRAASTGNRQRPRHRAAPPPLRPAPHLRHLRATRGDLPVFASPPLHGSAAALIDHHYGPPRRDSANTASPARRPLANRNERWPWLDAASNPQSAHHQRLSPVTRDSRRCR